jgi:hypothetical protein
MSANWPCVSHKSSSAKIGESEGDKDRGFVRNAQEHYGWERIKARTRLTEILYIFFGIHMANVVSPVVVENEKIGFPMKPMV